MVKRFLALVMLAGMALSVPATAMEGDAGGKPLMLIRFNQPKVYFERQLYTVVQKAVAIKGAVVFDVVSYVPAEQGDVRGGGAKVVDALKGMGVPDQRIAFSEVPSRGIADTEVHVNVH